MKYRSTHATHPLEFEFGGVHYVVDVGGTCDIDDKWASWVVSRGLHLEPYVEPLPAPEPAPEPVMVLERPAPSKKK